jgi:uncharacterized protein (TIGR02246 family)
MTPPTATHLAHQLLSELQGAVAAKSLDRMTALFTDDVVLFGTVAANVDREQTLAYVQAVLAQEGTIRWEFEQVLPVVHTPDVLAFACVGSVGFDDEAGHPDGDRQPFRLSCVAVEEDGRWRLSHFHGSVPEAE